MAAAAEFINSHPAGTEILLVGATREAVDDFVRGLSAEVGATFGLHRFTLKQLAARFAEPVLAAEGIAPCRTAGERGAGDARDVRGRVP